MRHESSKFEYSRISPHLFLGSDMCCAPHFKKELVSRGIRADISLRERHVDTPFGVKFFLWLPTKDGYAPTQAQLLAGASFIDVLIKQRIKVYVHCKAGHGRSPSLVTAYFIFKGSSLKEALKLVKSRRPSVHPNRIQINALKAFETETLRGGKE